jgi:diguanylate cyclase (GGDEF)-like protein
VRSGALKGACGPIDRLLELRREKMGSSYSRAEGVNMSEQIDPRLVEIEILSEADRAFVRGDSSYQYTKANPSGARDRQRDEALLGMLSDGAIVASVALRTSKNYVQIPDPNRPDPRFALDDAAAQAVGKFISGESILNLKITQAGRLRLYRLRDEILQRDRVRDDFGVLWSHRHWLPDLTVRLRLRDPSEPLSLIVLDVDHLKKLNTELGHPGANTVLTSIFEILRDVVQPYEASRIGGDEAGAILPGVTLDDAKKRGEEIRKTVETRSWPADLQIQTRPTVSVGVGTWLKESPIDASAFYKFVDAIAEQAKKDRNKVDAAIVPPISS